jgi:sigma-B regulation protein RsbU (phosphoserine phosphatase)
VGFAEYDSAGASRPAHGVGGDFYDMLPIDQDRFCVVVGDVSGKGTFAGLLAAAVQARIQTLIASGVTRPAALLTALNRLTVGTMEDHRFATVFYAVVNRRDHSVTYASAGHTPALLVDAAGAARELTATGPAIGWSSSARFPEISVPFLSGDRLVISSDGVTEATDLGGEPLDTTGLAELIRVTRDEASSASMDLVTRTLAAVDRLAGGAPAADDRTLVVVTALGSPERLGAKAAR